MPLTKLNNKAVANVTTLPVALGDMVLVSSATASSSASIEFTLGSYKEYKFFLVNIHPSVDSTGINFSMNYSTDNGSNYNVTKTSTFFRPFHFENDSNSVLGYYDTGDLAQSTSDQPLAVDIGNDNDQSVSGYLHLFNPSSSTFVKHWISNLQQTAYNDASFQRFTAGYANTVSPLTNIIFRFSSGNIDAGKILMFGIN